MSVDRDFAREPKLRPVQVIPIRDGAGVRIGLRDPDEDDQEILVLSPAAFLIAGMMDGTRSVEEIAVLAGERLGRGVPGEQVHEIARALDHLGFLDNERWRKRKELREAVFRSETVRRPAHAGAVYPSDEGECAAFIDSIIQAGRVGTIGGDVVRGLISPHIDYTRGKSGYAAAWASCRGRIDGVSRVVILGTCHSVGAQPYVLTRKDFETPLGCMETDRAVVDRLEETLGHDLTGEEWLHRREHSIELQLPFLQRLLPKPWPPIVPVLCASVHESAMLDPQGDNHRSALDALRSALRPELDSTLIVAAADLAHVGVSFGDRRPPEESWLETVSERDRELLLAAAKVDPEAVRWNVASDRDERRICGFGAIWTLLRLLDDAGLSGEVVHYGQAIDDERENMVSFGSVVYVRAEARVE